MRKINLLLLPAIIFLAISCSKSKVITDTTSGNTTSGGSTNNNGGIPVDSTKLSSDIIGKVIVGYQGWFTGLSDGSPVGNWSHYSSSGTPTPANVSIKCWPDVRDFTSTYQSGFAVLGNGSPAKLFSPWNQQTVDAQFQSMQRAGIDGAALQRFGSWISNTGSTNKAQDDGIAVRVMNAAQTYGRKFYIMYDCNATDPVTTDWTNTIVGTLHLTSSLAYAKQNGKPVVCLWGVGKSGRGAVGDWVNTINFFKNQGCYVIGGTLIGWRTDTANAACYNACNMIMPWIIGVIGSLANADNVYTNDTTPDLVYCAAHGIDYQQCVNPGDNSVRQRLHGNLMWEEFYNAVRAHVQGIYIAMFDEFNEGNQIAKTAESSAFIPTNATGGLIYGLDEDGTACSSDYYLRLTGDGGRMLKGLLGLTNIRPTPPTFTPPIGLTSSVLSGSSVQVIWPIIDGVPVYNVKRSTISGGPYTAVAAALTATGYTDTGLTANTTYYYVVTSGYINSCESVNSVEVSAKTTN
jgi:hypothetical protein